jgi:phenylalanyl-tRNA synthetase beta chain
VLNEQLPEEISQIPTLSGLVMGDLYPKQWSVGKDSVDFFAVKNDINAILKLFGNDQNIEYRVANFSALHPKRSATIYADGNFIGVVGEVHPKVKQELDLAQTAYLFELNLDTILQENKKNFSNVSKFPAIQRDIAIVVNKTISWQQIKQKILDNSQELLHNIELFDIYCGEGIGLENKSLAIRLVFQSQDCTLIDAQIETALNKIVNNLQQYFGANLRG